MDTELVERKRHNYWEKITQIYAIYILAVQPILWDKTRYSAITEFKFRAFWIPTVVYAAICLGVLIYSLFDKDGILKVRKNEIPLEFTIPQILCIGYTVWVLISAARSDFDLSHTWIGMGRFEGVFSVLLYSTAFILVSFWGEYSKWYLRSTVMFAVVFCFISVLQLFYDGIIHPEGYTYWSIHFMGTIGNIDCVGGIAAMVIPLLFGYYVFINDQVWDKIALGTMGVFTFLFVLTDVDSGKVGLIVAFAVACPFLFNERRYAIKALDALAVFAFAMFLEEFLNMGDHSFAITFEKKQLILLLGAIVLEWFAWFLRLSKFSLNISKKNATLLTIAIMVVFIVAGLLFVYFYAGSNRLVTEASEMLHGYLSDRAGSGRGYIWKTSWWLAKQNPIFGTGPGTFVATYYPYDILTTTTDFAHNDFLQIAVCVGIFGMILYVFFCISLAVRAFCKAYECPLIVIFGAACAGYLAHSFFSFSIAIVTPMFWVMAGIIDKLARQLEFTSSRKSEKKEHKQ